MEKTMKWIAAAAGAAAGLLTRMPMALRLLVLLMALDYLSGVGVALLGKSPKSEGGALSSRAGFAGLARKAMILVIVLLAPCSISSRGARPAPARRRCFISSTNRFRFWKMRCCSAYPCRSGCGRRSTWRGSPPTARRKKTRTVECCRGAVAAASRARRAQETFFKERVDKFRRVSYNIHVASLVQKVNMR